MRVIATAEPQKEFHVLQQTIVFRGSHKRVRTRAEESKESKESREFKGRKKATCDDKPLLQRPPLKTRKHGAPRMVPAVHPQECCSVGL